MITWGDADIFLTDDRWWRSADQMKDSINGKPNPEKRMLGKATNGLAKEFLVV
jgi:hypothetical protein